MLVTSVVGARPQFVKLGPICRAFDALPPGQCVNHKVIHTGQHYDSTLSDAFFRDLELPTPDVNLGVGSGSHGAQTSQMLQRLEDAFLRESPDMVLVYGDTNSTLAAALAAIKLHLPVAHVEAGLRSLRKDMPEEVNRILTDHVSTLLFCPTTTAVDNLAKEGIATGVDPLSASPDAPAVALVGDVMKDAVDQNLERAARRPRVAAKLSIEAGHYVVATVHRAENTDDFNRLCGIAEALGEIGRELRVVVPLHPRTRKALSGYGISMDSAEVQWIDPLSYLDMLQLVSQARLVLTDSGGLQKEAYLLGIPCVTLRDETEWVELVATGWNQLAGADPARILAAARHLLASTHDSGATNPYGDGRAAERIVAILSRVGR